MKVNHLGPFLLTMLLLPNIIKAKGRIVNVASFAHHYVPESIDWDEINKKQRLSGMGKHGMQSLSSPIYTLPENYINDMKQKKESKSVVYIQAQSCPKSYVKVKL